MNTQINVIIQGKTPLLLHRFTDASAISATSGTRSTIKTDSDTPREVAAQSLYFGADDETIIIPGPNLFRAIIDAGKFFKIGRSKITTRNSSIVPSCVEIEEIEIPIQHDEPWEVDTRPVVIPATKGRVLRHRPKFNDWKLAFTINLDSAEMSEKTLRDVVDKAGSAIGLGDFRPDCKGPFGKFVVTKWESVKMDKIRTNGHVEELVAVN